MKDLEVAYQTVIDEYVRQQDELLALDSDEL